MYRPLPDFLTIKKSDYLSDITKKDELGLFATEDIPFNTQLGITHLRPNHSFANKWIRTPLGGFYNHTTKNPNCFTEEDKWFDGAINRGHVRTLYSHREIKAGEEILVTYKLYDPTTIEDGDTKEA